MIDVNDTTPRWIRELDRFVRLKSMVFLHGRVLDLVSYPVKTADGQRTYWTESNLGQFLQRYLMGLNYEIVSVFDPVDGLSFAQDDMASRFKSLVKEGQTSGSRPALTRPAGPSDNRNDLDASIRDIAQAALNRETPCAFIFDFASRLAVSPDRLGRSEVNVFTRLLKASLQATEVIREGERWNNLIILICDQPNDLPAFLYLNNPRSRSIVIDAPDSVDRKRFFLANYNHFYRPVDDSNIPLASPSKDLVGLFTALTEGFSYYEMLSLIGLSLRERIPAQKIRTLCDRFKYGIVESDWDKLDKARLDQAGSIIRTRIKGQDAAVERLLEIIKRAKLGLSAGATRKSQRPRGVLFFAGPTGVGKTEMAKGLAELLFGQEERLIRFDMSEYASSHADQKLLGAPPGYIGYEAGGKLTNALKEQPFSVILFDEIEKADSSIFDKFLQILDDGRLTDGRGETVYFSESIIIFTSNLGTVSTRGGEPGGARQSLISPQMSHAEMSDIILDAIRDHFNLVLGRPEILNRFGENFVIFDYIRPPVDELIVDRLSELLQRSLAEQYQLELTIEDACRETLIKLSRENLAHGGRGIRNIVDAALVNPLSSLLFDQGGGEAGARSIDHSQQLPRET
ncbi:MAG: AAA family ATPase, partial [Pseudomonadales bacterium]|nr:AAA family ATPase [Pseudomonadales bacterium]